jgi:hypothetical protein
MYTDHDGKELETIGHVLECCADDSGIAVLTFDELNARLDARYHGE